MSIREQYIRYSLITIILVCGVILLKESMPYLGGILGAFTVYVLVRRQMLYLTEKKKLKKNTVATLLLLETILCILIPTALIVWFIIYKIQVFNFNINEFIGSIQNVANFIQEKTGYNVLREENLTTIASTATRIGQGLMGSVTSLTINFLVLLFVLYFMLIGGRKMEKYAYEILPFHRTDKRNVMQEIYMIVKSNAIGIPLLAIIQGGVALVGYYIFDAPNAFLLGVLTCFATIIPIVGTALVWVPLIVYMAIMGNWGDAIGMGLYAVLIITNIDNIVRSILLRKMADTHPLVTIFGVVIGLSLFGFMGIIFGPLLLSMFMLCVNLFKEDYLDNKNC